MITEACPCCEIFSRLHQDPHLHHATHPPAFRLTLNRELACHGVDMSTGTVYPILHGLGSAGYPGREDRVVGGKVRLTVPCLRCLEQHLAKQLHLARAG